MTISRSLSDSPQPFREPTPPSPPTPVLLPRSQHRDVGYGFVFFEHPMIDSDTHKPVIYHTFVPKNGYCPGCPGRSGPIVAAETSHAGPSHPPETKLSKYYEEQRIRECKAELDRLVWLKAEEDKIAKEIEEHIRLEQEFQARMKKNCRKQQIGHVQAHREIQPVEQTAETR